MGFIHRIPALFVACFTTLALLLLTLSGTVCDFLKIQAEDEGDTSAVSDMTSTYLGLICTNPLYDDVLEDDTMFIICRICLFASLGVGSFTCVLAWALSSFVSPTEANWKLLSVFAAVSALLQMPIFMLFEAEPCTSFDIDQECVLSTGGIYLITSSAFWVVVAVATTFLDPPRWSEEKNAWKRRGPDNTQNRATGRALILAPVPDDNAVDNESQAPLLKAKTKIDFRSRFQAWASSLRQRDTAELPFNHTDSLSVDEQQNDTQHQRSDDIAMTALVVRPDVEQPGLSNYRLTQTKDIFKQEAKADERRIVQYETLAPPSMDGGSFDSSQISQQQNRQLVVWEDSYDEQEAEQQVVDEIYADLEGQNPRGTETETQIILAEMSATNQHARSLDTPYAAPAELKSPMAHSDETQLVLAADQNQYATYVKEKYATTALMRHSAGKAKTKIMKTISGTLKKSRVASLANQKYAQMNDDDSVASLPLLPTEVLIRGYDNSSISEMPRETAAKHTEFPSFTPQALNSSSSSSNSSSSFDQSAYPDPKLSYVESCDESSLEDEEEPFLGIFPALEQDEGSVDWSNESEGDASSVSSESSDWRSALAQVKASSRRRRRQGGYSSVQSLVSSTSLLETIIDEETDADLSDPDYSLPYGLVRSMSAPTPTQVGATHDKSFQRHIHLDGHTSVSTLGLNHSDLENLQLAPYPKPSYDGTLYSEGENIVGDADRSQSSGMVPFDCYDTSIGTELEDQTLDESEELDAELEYLASLLSSPSDEMEALKPDPDGSYNDELSDAVSRPSESPLTTIEGDFPKTVKKASAAPASPTSTAPETPSPNRSMLDSYHFDPSIQDSSYQNDQSISFESEKSWKEDRELRGGIHAAPVPDDDSPGHHYLSRVACIREARIRRLQLEKASSNKSGGGFGEQQLLNSSATSSGVDTLDLQLIDLLREEGEYGLDEQSL